MYLASTFLGPAFSISETCGGLGITNQFQLRAPSPIYRISPNLIVVITAQLLLFYYLKGIKTYTIFEYARLLRRKRLSCDGSFTYRWRRSLAELVRRQLKDDQRSAYYC